MTLKCQRCTQYFQALRVDAKWCSSCRDIRAKERYEKYELHSKEPCPKCGKSMTRRSNLCISCENKTRSEKYKGENNPNWKNGWTRSEGYIYKRVKPTGEKGHPYYAEHRIVWEEKYGKLPDGYIVHHLNGNKSDNRLENLQARPRKEHSPKSIVEPYQKRIRELEDQLKGLTK